MEEIEIKFLDIDPVSLEQKLLALGAEKIGDYHYRRAVFDYSDFRLDQRAAWLRLRDEGDQVTFTFKQRLGVKEGSLKGDDEGMYEKEVVVSDFDATKEILLKTGLIEKMYQENRRTRYLLDGVECDIDTWPLIPPYLEIEGSSWESINAVAEKLGFKKEDAKKFSTNQIYRMHGLDDRNFVRLTFDEQKERTENRFS